MYISCPSRPLLPLKISSAGGTRGYFYKISLNLSRKANDLLFLYLAELDTFNVYVSKAYLLCWSSFRIEAMGIRLLTEEPPQAWPLDEDNLKHGCQGAIMLG